MEADWEAEVSADAPVIDACWSGLVDLRTNPDAVATLPEVRQFPLLANILLRLNGAASAQLAPTASPFWTAKCDLWTPEAIDPDEMEAGPDESAVTRACYIDLIPENPAVYASLAALESKARLIVSCLRAARLRCSRIDLVLRHAVVDDRCGFAITAYATACGSQVAAAEQTLAAALHLLVEAISCATAA